MECPYCFGRRRIWFWEPPPYGKVKGPIHIVECEHCGGKKRKDSDTRLQAAISWFMSATLPLTPVKLGGKTIACPQAYQVMLKRELSNPCSRWVEQAERDIMDLYDLLNTAEVL